jgi:hypothetical protein
VLQKHNNQVTALQLQLEALKQSHAAENKERGLSGKQSGQASKEARSKIAHLEAQLL